jgi:hypothetical protein
MKPFYVPITARPKRIKGPFSNVFRKFLNFSDITSYVYYIFYNLSYFFFFFSIILGVSGSFFEINSNFLLFFTFTSFLLFFYYLYNMYAYFYAINSISGLEGLNLLINYNLLILRLLRQILLNHQIFFYKTVFIFLKAINYFILINDESPIDINVSIRLFILSKIK